MRKGLNEPSRNPPDKIPRHVSFWGRGTVSLSTNDSDVVKEQGIDEAQAVKRAFARFVVL